MKKHLALFQKYIMLWVVLTVFVASSFLVVQELYHKNTAKVIFLDVGQGDAILVISPNGRQVLIDGGKYANISEKIADYIPMSDRSLDIMIATHPDIDHIAGINTLLDEYRIGLFLHSGLLAGESVYRSIAKKVRNNAIPVHAVSAGEKIFIDRDMYLEILSPYSGQKIDEPNDYSIVVRLVYKDSAVMLTGDAPKFVEQNLIKMYGKDKLQSDILKMGHHGSKTSSAEKFITAVHPRYGIISAGCNNSYGHPHASTLRILDEQNIDEINTCDHGDIVFEFRDGEWILE